MEPRNSYMSSHKDQIILTQRQASMIMASMIIVSLFIFITGYFLGKRTVINDFSSQVTQTALHDQIDYLLTSQSLQSSKDDDASLQENQELDEVPHVHVAHQASVSSEKIQIDSDLSSSAVKNSEIASHKKDAVINNTLQSDRQYACLIGFGTKTAANAFVARLKKHHISVILKTVISKTASGKTRTWFQAITPTYDSAKELQDVVNKVKRLEHIRDNDITFVHVK